MTTLVLRLDGPLQSYGDSSKFRARFTAPDPTLSALQGLLAAAAGIARDTPLPAPIADLTPTIRIERPGSTLRDFHTVNPLAVDAIRGLDDLDRGTRKQLVVIRRGGGTAATDPVVTDRYYRQDATYLVLLPDPDGQLETWLRAPTWGLYAGRRACVLTAPFVLGRTPLAADDAAAQLPTVPANGDDDASREVITFAEPDRPIRTDVRQDRITSTRRHTQQRRWYQRVAVPTVEDWFAVARHLTNHQAGTAC